MSGKTNPSPLPGEGLPGLFRLGKNLLLLLGFFLVGLFLATFISSAFPQGDLGAMFLQAALQALFAFALPGIAMNMLLRREGHALFRLDQRPDWKCIFIAIGLAIIATTGLNQIIYWNQQMHLPAAFSHIEESWRRMEEVNAAFTAKLTSGTTGWDLAVSLMTVGLLTGFSEEVFFRGALLGTLRRAGISAGWSVWIAATIFSLMHFQMFGFIPRLLLGAWFGYLFVWSRNIWLPVAAHVWNNSFVVLSLWLSNRGILPEDADAIGVVEHGFPWTPLFSALAFTGFLIFLRKNLICSNHGQENH